MCTFLNIFVKLGQNRPLFHLYSIFRGNYYTIKIADMNWIRTQIVGIEDDYADQFTTSTMAQSFE